MNGGQGTTFQTVSVRLRSKFERMAVNSLLDEPSCPLPYSRLLSEHCTLSFLLAAALGNLLQAAEMVQLLEARLKTKKKEREREKLVTPPGGWSAADRNVFKSEIWEVCKTFLFFFC